jgi:SAM-dependent methyltransferase
VHPTNAEQAQSWDGDGGAYWAENAERFDRAMAAYQGPFMEASAITASDRVLDVGCGNGRTTRDAARAATGGSALGVDLSTRMLEHARRSAAAERLDNVTYEQADAQVHPFTPSGFDVAISRMGAMFFGDPRAAFSNIARALQPGGRLVLLTWQGRAENEWIRELSGVLAAGRTLPVPPADAPGPFALSDPDRIRAILSESGFADIRIDGSAEGMWFGRDVDDASRFVLGLMGGMLEGLDDSGRAKAAEDLRAALSAHLTDDGVILGSAAWTVHAVRPGSLQGKERIDQ